MLFVNTNIKKGDITKFFMAECYRCGVSDERERLFNAISNKGVVKVCKNCSSSEDFPLIQPVDLTKPERVKTVYERLSSMANLDPQKHRVAMQERAREDSMRKRRQDTTLKDVIDSNLEKKKPQPRTDLVTNFHWILMRARRGKKLTQKQLAENIGETEAAIKSAEDGMILSNADTLVRKLEGYLGVKIRKGEGSYSPEVSRQVKPGINEDPERRAIRERFEKEGNFDPKTTEALTIEDLQEIKKKKEAEGTGGFFSFLKRKKRPEDSEYEEDEKSAGEGDISDKEANDILFGK
jgi:ribosome-binding protein aMBF1 (putative translation factor)